MDWKELRKCACVIKRNLDQSRQNGDTFIDDNPENKMEYLVLAQLADKKKSIPVTVTKDKCSQMLEKYKLMMFMKNRNISFCFSINEDTPDEYFLAGPKELKEIVWKYILSSFSYKNN